MPIISIQTVPKWPLTQIRLTLPPSPDLFCHSIESQRQCDVAKWKNGSRECVCHGLARYSFAYGQEHQLKVLEQDGQTLLEEAMTTTMIVIVAVSSSLLVASLLSAALLVIYCRRVKVLENINTISRSNLMEFLLVRRKMWPIFKQNLSKISILF